MLIDAHCHLNSLSPDQINNIVPSLDRGFYLIDSSIDLKSSYASLLLSEKYEFVYSSLGFHPFSADLFSNQTLSEYEKLIDSNKKVIAIGEVGLDQKADIPLEKQEEVFESFINLAKRKNLALLIHNRLDNFRILEVLDKNLTSYSKVIFHCFSYSEDFLQRIIEREGFASFSLNVLRKRESLISALKACPMKNLLLETDSPYMRIDSRESNPQDIEKVYDFASKTKGINREDLEREVFENINKLFSLRETS